MKTKVLKEFEIVELTHDIPEHKLKKGESGTIVEIYKGGKAYEVEFVNEGGKTLALLTLTSDEISSVRENDVLHARGFSTA